MAAHEHGGQLGVVSRVHGAAAAPNKQVVVEPAAVAFLHSLKPLDEGSRSSPPDTMWWPPKSRQKTCFPRLLPALAMFSFPSVGSSRPALRPGERDPPDGIGLHATLARSWHCFATVLGHLTVVLRSCGLSWALLRCSGDIASNSYGITPLQCSGTRLWGGQDRLRNLSRQEPAGTGFLSSCLDYAVRFLRQFVLLPGALGISPFPSHSGREFQFLDTLT